MNVLNISASISVTITDIWTKFNTEHKYRTINTPEWPNSHKLKTKMAAAAIFNFGKMSITPHWIKISAPNFTGRCITAMRRWPRDQKSKTGVKLPKNSNFGRVQAWTTKISNPYNLKTTDPIMTKFIQGVRTASGWSHNFPLQIQDGGGRHL